MATRATLFAEWQPGRQTREPGKAKAGIGSLAVGTWLALGSSDGSGLLFSGIEQFRA